MSFPPSSTCLNRMIDTVDSSVCEVKNEMCLLYPDSTVQEWVDQHVTPVLEPLQKLMRDIESVLSDVGFCMESMS